MMQRPEGRKYSRPHYLRYQHVVVRQAVEEVERHGSLPPLACQDFVKSSAAKYFLKCHQLANNNKMKSTKSRAAQLAQLQGSVRKNYDPEDDSADIQDSDDEDRSQDSGDDLRGTEHYAEVGKSKLRKPEEVPLGPKYAGSRISRKELLEPESDDDVHMGDGDNDSDAEENFVDPDQLEFEVDDQDGDIDSDDALGDNDMERFKNFTFRGSSKPTLSKEIRRRPTAADFMSDSEEESEGSAQAGEVTSQEKKGGSPDSDDESDHSDEGPSENEISEDEHHSMDYDEKSDLDSDDNAEETGTSERAELKRMMEEEQKSVVATLSQAAKADADKGTAVKQQRKTLDSFLNIRIKLQKALVATNSMTALVGVEDDPSAVYQAAEEAAIKLWNTLDGMRHQLAKSGDSSKTGRKRKHEVDATTPSQVMWEQMESLEKESAEIRRATLDRWSTKLNRTTAGPISSKLKNTASQQSIIDILEGQLSNTERLVKRTKLPRSCAPVQVKQKVTEDPNIFDDADFYQLLLKELVDSRMMDASAAGGGGGLEGMHPTRWAAVKDAKTKRHVDTKASKGRKMRFTVHEKLQNFMAPDDRGQWEPAAIDRFFSTLLGQKNSLGEDDREASGKEEDGKLAEDEALILFRS